MSRGAYKAGEEVFNWKYYEETLEAVISGADDVINVREIKYEHNISELQKWEKEDNENRKTRKWRMAFWKK